ncbi:radical SAM protein [Carboxylicivirga sp. A043]|uniref:B12-binding domain-containing radical SAM protein n=1 Tax=Carboxylicivirga litoralis TaxID=2816963 RepID=UPI0021CB2E86|nr:radical SAM protein [Carboxylicivirga sp. A043]MCU4157617.1 radical SAM protein [Carboxylicivirga sp. A043]
MAQVLLITPPFTQLNTPYPATAYLKGYLNTLKVDSFQADLGIDVIHRLFSHQGLSRLFGQVDERNIVSENAHRIYWLREEYVNSIERVMEFLREPTVLDAQNITQGNVLPEASRFNHLQDEADTFGTMGLLDKAKHYCTLFLEDLSDFIVEVVDSNFGFSRYAERLGRSASCFDELYERLQEPLSFIEEILVDELRCLMQEFQPELVLLSIPFPGNLLGALRVGQFIRKYHPQAKISLGGGFVNTELRDLKDERVFQFCDYITLDDGEMPITCLLEQIEGKRKQSELKRTIVCTAKGVELIDGAKEPDASQVELGTPDYSDLDWNKYISVLETANPMFRLWSDGQWLKLTLAHGCYWGRCTFCDGSLDYIKRFEPNSVSIIVDRMETLIEQTGKHGFHFVDEAAPPALLKELAIEIIKRNLKVVWWTNIRFEKSFTADLCLLLKQSGCIAVAGGLEVASDRILKLIKKGVSIEQVSNVTASLTEAGIMVHAYLMYGFPSQTAQETIDSLEVVRQLFELGIVNSGFWHQFALTAHSPVGLNPDAYNVSITNGLDGTFANNDLEFIDKAGAIHEQFGEGLKKALYNYMHGLCFDWPLSEWFEFKVPKTTLPADYIESKLSDDIRIKENSRVIWLAKEPLLKPFTKRKGKKEVQMTELILFSAKTHVQLTTKGSLGYWLKNILSKASLGEEPLNFKSFQQDYEANQLGNFNKFINSYTFSQLKAAGLVIV